jgi:hypothetical protein
MVGDRVTIKCGVQLWDGITLENDVFVGPNATFTNDPFPRSKKYPKRFSRTIIRMGASIGANATILPGVEIGAGAMIGAGTVVTRSVPANAIAYGNPARIRGYVDAATGGEEFGMRPQVVGRKEVQRAPVGVGGVELFQFPLIKDMRGDLTVSEFERDLPFTPRRHFVVFSVSSREIRGEHAHKRCHQMFFCVHGSCKVLVDDGIARREISLDHPSMGVYVPPMIWGTQYQYSPDASLLVLASEPYTPSDYVRSYEEFRRLKTGQIA